MNTLAIVPVTSEAPSMDVLEREESIMPINRLMRHVERERGEERYCGHASVFMIVIALFTGDDKKDTVREKERG